MKFGLEIGNKLWRNEMPVIEGDGAIDDDEFEEHCDEVRQAISNISPQKYAILKPAKSGFWEVKWHTTWRQREWTWMIDGFYEVPRTSFAHH
jgi:hypothetical protein